MCFFLHFVDAYIFVECIACYWRESNRRRNQWFCLELDVEQLCIHIICVEKCVSSSHVTIDTRSSSIDWFRMMSRNVCSESMIQFTSIIQQAPAFAPQNTHEVHAGSINREIIYKNYKLILSQHDHLPTVCSSQIFSTSICIHFICALPPYQMVNWQAMFSAEATHMKWRIKANCLARYLLSRQITNGHFLTTSSGHIWRAVKKSRAAKAIASVVCVCTH